VPGSGVAVLAGLLAGRWLADRVGRRLRPAGANRKTSGPISKGPGLVAVSRVAPAGYPAAAKTSVQTLPIFCA
jgi:hypothetical protein